MVNENYTPGGGDKKVNRTIIHVIIDTWYKWMFFLRDLEHAMQ